MPEQLSDIDIIRLDGAVHLSPTQLFGRCLSIVRRDCNQNSDEWAQTIGVSPEEFGSIEAGKIDYLPTEEMIIPWAGAWNLSPEATDDLLSAAGYPRPIRPLSFEEKAIIRTSINEMLARRKPSILYRIDVGIFLVQTRIEARLRNIFHRE